MKNLAKNRLCRLIAILVILPLRAWASEFDPGIINFSVQFNGIESRHKVMTFFVLPNEQIRISTPPHVTMRAPDFLEQTEQANQILMQSPMKAGLYKIQLDGDGKAVMTLNVFVMRPYSDLKDGYIDRYRMGDYPKEPYRGLEAYQPPQGFIEVHDNMLDLQISPHFTLGLFRCKQPYKGGKQFMVLRTEMLLKLETVLAEVNGRGIRTDTFFVMSGYRTPYYNKSIGNGKYSRHIYGGAADIFIDVSPKDGVMDDLNKDGKVDRGDAQFLYDLVETRSRKSNWSYVGGLGKYGSTGSHGPFVHIDARAYRARW